MEVKKDILWRIYLVYVFVCLFGLIIIGQIFRIQIIEGKYWRNKADSLTTAYENIEAIRGNIYAIDGSLLATSVPIYEVRMDLNAYAITNEIFYKNVDSLAICLAKMFKDKTQKEYRRELIKSRKEGERYHLIQRNVTFSQLKKMKEWPIFRLGRYKGGLIAEAKSKREKPFRSLAARTIGYEIEGIKPVGLEGAYSQYLKGISGKRLKQKIGGNVWIPINDDNEIEPKDGHDLITTIDINIQDVAEHSLLNQLIRHNADHGCVILMEVETGEIKAIANLSRKDSLTYEESYNYAIGESTEPGSTFKLASLMVAIEDGFVDIDDSIETGNGTIKYFDRIMKDSHEGGYGKITLRRAFEVSSNVAISKVINNNYIKNPQRFIDNLYKMRLNEPLGLQIAGEPKPQIKSTRDKNWYGTTLPWMSIGYEVRLTPLQILAFYNAVANDGRLVKPMLVKEIQQTGKPVKRFVTTTLNDEICSEVTLKKVRKLLEGVVENGTAENLRNPDYKIAGKTGTAQIANDKYGYKYKTKISYQASFVGYFPADNPKYSCIVVVNGPSNNVYYGNLVAGPVFKEIADKVYANRLEMHKELDYKIVKAPKPFPLTKTGFQKDIQQVYKDLSLKFQATKADWVTVIKADSIAHLAEKKFLSGLVPDVMGMGLKDAIYLLENAGLQVKVLGRGAVVNQSIEPGSKIVKGSEIIIELS